MAACSLPTPPGHLLNSTWKLDTIGGNSAGTSGVEAATSRADRAALSTWVRASSRWCSGTSPDNCFRQRRSLQFLRVQPGRRHQFAAPRAPATSSARARSSEPCRTTEGSRSAGLPPTASSASERRTAGCPSRHRVTVDQRGAAHGQGRERLPPPWLRRGRTGDTHARPTPTTPPTPITATGSSDPTAASSSFGSAQFYGSAGSFDAAASSRRYRRRPSQAGYWLDASDGGIFAFGDAGFYGSIPASGLHPAGRAAGHPQRPDRRHGASSDGGGYFMVASDGGVFAFGDAKFAG